jgi:hypothetical protein
MAQVTAHELLTGERESLGATSVGAIFPAKGDGRFADLEDASIANSGPGDIVAKILEGGGAGADGLDMHVPVLPPSPRIDLPLVVAQQLAKTLAKSGLEMRQVDEEVSLLDAHRLSFGLQSGAGNQEVQVRVKT